MSHAVPPGPTGLSGLRELAAFATNPLPTVLKLHERYGPIMHVRLPRADLSVVFEPAGVEQLFTLPTAVVRKDPTTRSLGEILGDGLIPADGRAWERNRKLIGPMLLRKRVGIYTDVIVEQASAYAEALDGVRDVSADLLNLTLQGISRAVFGPEVAIDTQAIGSGLKGFTDEFYRENKTLWRLVPKAIPTPVRRRKREAVEQLDRAILDAIEERRRAPIGEDLLSGLLEARYPDGNRLSDAQIRDECVTLLLAGNETTALAVSYALFELAKKPHLWQQVVDQVDARVGARRVSTGDLSALTTVDSALREAMRLYPPVWVVGRELIEPAEILGYTMPAGAHVGACQYVVHRDPRWYPEPNQYRPERWNGETKGNPRYAFFPFGGGPRVCVGSQFAMMQASLILATIAQHAVPSPTNNDPLTLTPSVSLRPTYGVPLTFTKR